MAPDTNAWAVALTEMRKQRQRGRHGRSHGDDAENRVESEAADRSETLDEDVLVAPSGRIPAGPAPEGLAPAEEGMAEPSHDLDSLGREIERNLAGSSSSEKLSPAQAQSKAILPPSRNATPEDILGMNTQLYEQVEESPPAEHPEGSPTSNFIGSETGGPPPMEDFEERAAMAKEVLRATSDQSRRSRKPPKAEATGEPAEETGAPEELGDVADENVRFSEDFTISAKKRPRRKLFGR
jgi:hypothetical protein